MENTEKLLVKFDLQSIDSFYLIQAIVSDCYKQTGEKITVSFNGSKGYLDNISISCEGQKSNSNILIVDDIKNKNGTLKKKVVNVFYSFENGVRLTLTRK